LIDNPNLVDSLVQILSMFGKTTLVEGNYESSKVLMLSSSATDYEWIMDSECPFHMTPNCLQFYKFIELEEG